MSVLISNAIAYGVLPSLLLGSLMLASFALAPDMWVGDYPPDIREKYGQMSLKARRLRPVVATAFLATIMVVVALSLARLHRLTETNLSFGTSSLSTFIVLMVFNVIDLVVADWLVFVTIQPKAIILPGTEGLAGYKDYGFHFRGFLIGILFSAAGALVSALLTVVLV